MPPGPRKGEERADPGVITRLLHEGRAGSESARDRLVGLIYDELHLIAASLMRREREGHTLQSTALVHEAWLRLSGPHTDWSNRRHFFGAAARAMRQVLTDHARRKRRLKRDAGRLDIVTLAHQPAGDTGAFLDVLTLNDALEELERLDSRKAAAIELHYYAGLSYEEPARNDFLRYGSRVPRRNGTCDGLRSEEAGRSRAEWDRIPCETGSPPRPGPDRRERPWVGDEPQLPGVRTIPFSRISARMVSGGYCST